MRAFVHPLRRPRQSATAAGAIKAELGLSNTELGVAFSAFAYSYAICQIGGGWIADRFGARITLIGCGLIWVVSTFTTGLVHSLGLLFAARLLLGIGEGATLPAPRRQPAHPPPPHFVHRTTNLEQKVSVDVFF